MLLRRLFLLFIFFLLVLGSDSAFGQTPDLPSSVVTFASNERINIYSIGPDEIADVTGFIIGDEVVSEIREGGVADPTINIFMTNRISRHLEESSDPLSVIKDALQSGEIRIQGVGVKSGIKISGFLEGLKRLAPDTEKASPKVARPITSVEDSLGSVSKRTGEASYTIDEDSGLKNSVVEFDAPKITADDAVIIKEYSDLGFDEVPEGVNSLPFTGKEESAGMFIDIETPASVEKLALTIRYDEVDLYRRGIKEENLVLKWYNEDTGLWVTLDEGVSNILKLQHDTAANFIRMLRGGHNSVYGIGGSIGITTVPDTIKVRKEPLSPTAVSIQTPSDAEVVKVSTGSPNYIAWVAGILGLIIIAVIGLVVYRRRVKSKAAPEVVEESLEKSSPPAPGETESLEETPAEEG